MAKLELSTEELELFQQCRAKWWLHLHDTSKGTRVLIDDVYQEAIRNALHALYGRILIGPRRGSILPSRGLLRELWDREWWQKVLDRGWGENRNAEIIEKAARGWIWLSRFYDRVFEPPNIETSHLYIHPIATNLSLSIELDHILFTCHASVIFLDQQKQIGLIDFGSWGTDWAVYNSLITKLQLVSIQQELDIAPAYKMWYHLGSDNCDTHLIRFNEGYIKRANQVIRAIARDISQGIIYNSPSRACKECEYGGQCWN